MQDVTQLLRDIRDRINAVAVQRDLSREQLAPKLGMTYSWLCKFMQEHKDARNPRIQTVEKVLKGLERLERGAPVSNNSEARVS